MGRREDSKQQRRERIVAAAKRLLEQGGAEALSMRKLALEADVSEATPYNLFGSKAGVIEALLHESLSEIVQSSFANPSDNPLDRLFSGQEALASTWAASPGLFQVLIQSAVQTDSNLHEMPIAILHRGLQEAAEAGQINQDVPLSLLARQVFFANQGAFEHWVKNGSKPEQLRDDLTVALCAALLGVAEESARELLLARLPKT